eukprot:m.287620 g.287620  ORF g.287620 m.287620 type:complete len:57 (+) comp11814_c0_seq1:2467-2637(+)
MVIPFPCTLFLAPLLRVTSVPLPAQVSPPTVLYLFFSFFPLVSLFVSLSSSALCCI